MGVKFSLYRYQLLPIDRRDKNVEIIVQQKNHIFEELLPFFPKFIHENNKRLQTINACFPLDKEKILFTIEYFQNSNNDSSRRSNKKFRIFFWNNSSKQIIAIEHCLQIYRNPSAFIKIIDKEFSKELLKKNLAIYIEPILDLTSFFKPELVNNINELELELITPNMANISGALENFKKFACDANAVSSKLSIKSNENSKLDITDTLGILIDYVKNGGGKISVKVDKFKSKKTAKETVISFDQLDISMDSSVVIDQLVDKIKDSNIL